MKQLKPLESMIFSIRNHKMNIDCDLAALYNVPTKALNQAVKRNADRFLAISSFDSLQRSECRWSQIVTGSQKHRDPRFRPWAFTEHGDVMAANILHSERAILMSVFVVRAFVRLREHIAANRTILKRLLRLTRPCSRTRPSWSTCMRDSSRCSNRFPTHPNLESVSVEGESVIGWIGKSTVAIFLPENRRSFSGESNDAEEKRLVGQVWASRSSRRCLYVMPTEGDFAVIARAVTPI